MLRSFKVIPPKEIARSSSYFGGMVMIVSCPSSWTSQIQLLELGMWRCNSIMSCAALKWTPSNSDLCRVMVCGALDQCMRNLVKPLTICCISNPLYNYLWSFHHWTFLFDMFFTLTHLTEDRYRGVRLQFFTTQVMCN